MKRTLSVMLSVVCAVLFLGLASPSMAQDKHASPMVNLHYDGNWPSDKEAQ